MSQNKEGLMMKVNKNCEYRKKYIDLAFEMEQLVNMGYEKDSNFNLIFELEQLLKKGYKNDYK